MDHATATPKRPRLPGWLSPPVLLSALPSLGVVAFSTISAPIAILLGFTPVLLVAPVLIWIDRVEPEPWSSRLHAGLWGAFVAGLIGLVSNTIVAVTASENWAAVVSAPLSEEIGKGLGILWAVRRRELDGVMDGLVYAGWVGLGFAVIEDFGYFAFAEDEGALLQVFVGRALLTPFAHPLFTAWTGLAIGLAVARRRSLWTALWGLIVAILLHAAWNGTLVAAGPTDTSDGEPLLLLAVIGLFICLFLITALAMIRLRRRDEKRFTELVPFLADRYALQTTDIQLYGDRRTMLAVRKTLPKDERRRFDRRHAAIARLAALHDQPGEPDPADAARLTLQLHEAT